MVDYALGGMAGFNQSSLPGYRNNAPTTNQSTLFGGQLQINPNDNSIKLTERLAVQLEQLNNTGGTMFDVQDNLNMVATLNDVEFRSQNMTECVQVPSSEHVAEIVGRQGESCNLCFRFDYFFS